MSSTSAPKKPKKRPWSAVFGVGLLALMALLIYQSRHEVGEAFRLLRNADPLWIGAALLAITAGFVLGGLIYGRVLATLGFRASLPWLTATALVAILINQLLPAGAVVAYAFLVTSLRRRGFPSGSVAMVAGLELLSWNGAVLTAFVYGLIFLLVTTGASGASVSYAAVGFAAGLLLFILYMGTRPDESLRAFGLRIKSFALMRLNMLIDSVRVHQIIEEIISSRRTMLEHPGRMLSLVGMQLGIFGLHGLALLALLYALGVSTPYFAVMAAYGLSLIASAFVVLPGGGGAVEAALTVSLRAQGVPADAAIGAAIVFRLLNFWMLLPLGAVCYQWLTHRSVVRDTVEIAQAETAEEAIEIVNETKDLR